MKIDNVNIQHIVVILFCGLGLVFSIIKGEENLALSLGAGLVGYLGGSGSTDNMNYSITKKDKKNEF